MIEPVPPGHPASEIFSASLEPLPPVGPLVRLLSVILWILWPFVPFEPRYSVVVRRSGAGNCIGVANAVTLRRAKTLLEGVEEELATLTSRQFCLKHGLEELQAGE